MSLLSARLQKLIKKTADVDKDERYMATSDLAHELTQLDEQANNTAAAAKPTNAAQPASSALDTTLQLLLGRTIITLLEDSSTDVQSVSVKCLAILCRRLNSEQVYSIVEKLSQFICDPAIEKSNSRDIYAIGIKTMIHSVGNINVTTGPTPNFLPDASASLGVNMSYRIINGMMNGLKTLPTNGQLNATQLDITATILDITKEVLNKFGAHINEVHQVLLEVLTPRLESTHEVVRKRTITTLSALVPYLHDAPFHSFLELIIANLARHEDGGKSASGAKQNENMFLFTYLQMLSVVSTMAGARIGAYLNKIVPQLERFLTLPTAGTKAGTEESQLLELWEWTLSAFESLLLRCPLEFVPFLPSVLKRAEDFMRYDPNYFYAPEEDATRDEDTNMDDGRTEGQAAEGEDEEWGGGDAGWGDDGDAEQMDEVEDDSDDASWKVRRAAVKVLSAFIRSKSTLLTSTTTASLTTSNWAHLCDILLERFKERHQSVKVVIIQAVHDLVHECATSNAVMNIHGAVSVSIAPAASNDMMKILLTKLSAIMSAAMKQLTTQSKSALTNSAVMETKHFICTLLCELVCIVHGGLEASYLPKLIPLVLSNLSTSGIKIELKLDAIHLTRACVEMHPIQKWFGAPGDINTAKVGAELISSIVAALIQSFGETPYITFRVEVLQTANSLINLLGMLKRQQQQLQAGAAEGSNTQSSYTTIVTPPLLSTFYSSLFYSTLQLNDVDQELKEYTLNGVGNFFFFFGRELQNDLDDQRNRLKECISIILQQRLTNELTRVASLRCLTRICQAPKDDHLDVYSYVFSNTAIGAASSSAAPAASAAADHYRIIDELISFLRKDSQILKYETVQTLSGLLTNIQDQTGANGKQPPSFSAMQFSSLLKELLNHLNDTDLNLSTSVLTLLTKLFEVFPLISIFSTQVQAVQDIDIFLIRLMQFLRSPLLQQQNIVSVVILFRVIMKLVYGGSGKPATLNPHLSFQYLFDYFLSHLSVGSLSSATTSPTLAPQASPSTASSSASAVVSSATTIYLTNISQIVGSGLLLHIPAQEQATIISKLLLIIQGNAGAASTIEMKQCSLLMLGEVGRSISLPTLHESLFFQCFTHESEAIRNSSSVAFGNVMLGNLSYYLPTLLKQLSDQSVVQRKDILMLLLNSLKEATNIIERGSLNVVQQFRTFLPTILPLVCSHAEHSEESIRSLVSEVLGGLLLIDSRTTFPEMVRLLASPQPFTRSIVITALRHALTQQQQHEHAQHINSVHNLIASTNILVLDSALLQQHLPSFLSLLRDIDLGVRRQAILTVNALAHSKSHAHHLLLVPSFESEILPILYHHLVQDPSLVRIVDLGPFKQKIDDGFPLRKAAYQTLDTLLDVALPSLDAANLIRHISQGLSDHDDIIILVYQMLEKCSTRHAQQLLTVLDTLPGKMMDGVKEKLKIAKTVPVDAAPPTAAAAASSASAAAASSASGVSGDASTAERAKDVLRAAVRCFQALQSMPGITACPQFIELYQRVLKTAMLSRMIEEMQKTV